MRKPKVKRFSLETIVETVIRLSDLDAARRSLSLAVGAAAVCLSDCRMQGKSKERARKRARSWTELDTKKENQNLTFRHKNFAICTNENFAFTKIFP